MQSDNVMKPSFKQGKMSRLDRKYWVIKQVSRVLLVTVTLQLFLPTQSKALTTGPSQPEVMQFQQAGTSGMVDPFTGAFNYNIPLFELPGPNGSYPFNLAYQSGVNMDQEASWVGLGWSLNPGAITRNMRGLPDEFDGDAVKIEQHMKPDWTVGVNGNYGFELFGADANIAGTLDLGVSLYYNSYRGLGYKAGGGFDVGFGNDMTVGGGLNLSLDAQDGIDVSPKLSFGKKGERTNAKFSAGLGWNSRRGLTDISMTATSTQNIITGSRLASKDGPARATSRTSGQIGGSSTLYSASNGSMPFIDKEMGGYSVSINLKAGAVSGADPNFSIGGYYNRNFLAWDVKDIPSYGYLNMHKAAPEDMVDVNRASDGVIRKETPNLAVPILTNDVYSISGQGTGGAFRAWRNDVGVVGNRKMYSGNASGHIGTELNPFKGALDGSLGLSVSSSGMWENANDAVRDANHPNLYGFHGGDGYRADYEPWYFKVEGDLGTDPLGDLNYIGGDEPVRLAVNIDSDGSGRKLGHLYEGLEDKNGNPIGGLNARESYLTDPNRRPRNQVVNHVRVKEIKTNPTGFGEYEIKHFTNSQGSFAPNHAVPGVALSRSHPDHHFAGMSVDQADGSRYVYGLPAYNKKQVECLFTADGSSVTCDPRINIDYNTQNNKINYEVFGTDQYLHRTEMPAYAHSYLLTSMLGQDYVDADNVPGPSDGDLGFWVKFNYVKVNDYRWRAPFAGANLDKGQRSTIEDDKANYMYGEREEWYLASAETKTHVAEFEISERDDNRGALKELQNLNAGVSGTQLGNSYRLDRVSLYSKLELVQNQNAAPITSVAFEYSYELCLDLPNNVYYAGAGTQTPNSGKLTLKKVVFTHENSTRGQNNPFEFEYSTENPSYDAMAQDKWGNYRPVGNKCIAGAYPYTQQSTTRQDLDRQNSAWHLVGIKLPTGGEMTIDYEANDYAYVQDKPAMEMYLLKGTSADHSSSSYSDKVYNSSYNGSNPSPSRAQQRRLYIDLGPNRTVNTQSEIDRIVGKNSAVYLKCLMTLKKPNHSIREYVETFLEKDAMEYGPHLVGGQTLAQGAQLIYIELKECDWNEGKLSEYHPLAVAAWTHLRSSLPQMLSLPAFATPAPDPGTSAFARKQMVKSLASAGPELARMFGGFYNNADLEMWAEDFDPDSSWVRLNSFDMRKVGGGCRVKRITISDDFDLGNGSSDNLETGVVYDYSMTENGKVISSGVAAYEPMLGGDENPLHGYKRYPSATPLMSDYNLFQSTPTNEHYMPGPSIGYRRVTVKSLNTELVTTGQIAATIPSTGAVVHEFWTAKDFPVVSEETVARIKPFRLNIPVPFIGYFGYNDLTGSQGYSIVLNDMHGKPKRVSNYGVDPDGHIIDAPISWVEYEYAETTVNGGTANETHRVQNKVNALLFDVDPNDHSRSLIAQKVLGQDHEFFVDMREYDTHSGSIGAAGNADFVILGFLPSIWPNATYSKSRVRTAVTNKIVHRQGLLTGTRSFNQGSLVKSDNLLYDAQTGRPLLTRVTNDYDAPIYSYEYPAFWAYDRMGPAYKNIGVELNGLTASAVGNGLFSVAGAGIGSAYEGLLIPGDELMVTPVSSGPRKAWFVGFDGGNARFYSEVAVGNGAVDLRVQKSGRRNLLNVAAEQIVSLRNPTVNRGNQMCWRDVVNPTAVVETTWVSTHIVQDTALAPCLENMEWILNIFFQHPASVADPGSIYYEPALSAPFGCGDCEINSIDATSTSQITIECTAIGCTFEILDDAAVPILIADIDRIENINLVLNAPTNTIGAGYTFGISMDVYLIGSNSPVTGWFSGCPAIFAQGLVISEQEVNEYHSSLTATPSDDILSTEMFMLDSVLSANATTFSDAWMQDYSDVRFSGANPAAQLHRLETLHPFANGQRGVWRGKDSYVYVTDRRQSPDINTGKDGTFSGMPMFDFQSITFDHCASNWRKTNEVTRYSPYGNELENRDVLNVYSSALYGYNGKLPIVVSANADYREVGFESFEEYKTGNGAAYPYNVLELSTGNLDFPTDLSASPRNIWTYTDIKNGESNHFYLHGSMTNSILINPLTGANLVGMVQGRTHGSIEKPTVPFGEKQLVTLNGLLAMNTNAAPYLHQFSNFPMQYAGRVVYQRPTLILPPNGPQNVGYTAAKAHTGKQSLAITGEGKFPQNRLKLTGGESYTIQLWVSKDNTDVPTYRDNNLNVLDQLGAAVGYYDAGGVLVGGSGIFQPTGELVEGWQKIEGNFTVPANVENIGIRLFSGLDGRDPSVAYFDDIRIQPLKSKMTCYVYDPSNYKLRATLDDDNFALVYRYDEAGNLYLVQKETVEGMRTIQESRGFMAE